MYVKNKCPFYINEVFRSAGKIRINTENSYRKLNYPFQKPVPDKTTCLVLHLSRIPEILKKTEI